MQQHPHEVSLPAEAFARLRDSLIHEVGDGRGIQALHSAGFATGDAVYDLLAGAAGGTTTPESLESGAFWELLERHFRERGWGTLEHESPHPGVSILASEDWVEASSREDDQPTCAFTAGLLAAALTRLAHAPVAVLETACRARGDHRCEFAFGSRWTIQTLYEALLEGASMEHALSRLDNADPPSS